MWNSLFVFLVLLFPLQFANAQDTSMLQNGLFINKSDTLSVDFGSIKNSNFFNYFDTINLSNKLIYGSFRAEDDRFEYQFVEFDFATNTCKTYYVLNDKATLLDVNFLNSDSLKLKFLDQYYKKYISYKSKLELRTCKTLEVQFILSESFKLEFTSMDASHRVMYRYYLSLISPNLPRAEFRFWN